LILAITHSFLGHLHLAKGDQPRSAAFFGQGESELKQLRTAGNDSVLVRSVLLEVEAHLGHRDEAQTLIESLLESDRGDAWQLPRTEESVARAYVALHDFDRALPLLERALSVPSAEALTAAYLRIDPSWAPIRNDPRFQKLANAK
jgi:tetratricopeptide (TPR) repeat protein